MSKAKSITTQPQTMEELKKIPLNNLKKFKNHTFKEYKDKQLDELVESIKEHGVITPILVRPISDSLDYEIISGHNRVKAAKKAELEVIPAIIREMNEDEAILCMVESNLNQRKEMLPSEKARTYKLHIDALNRQGKRTDLTTSVQVERKSSRDEVAIMNNETPSQIQRYIRLNSLIDNFLDSVDDKLIHLTVAVNISYLRKNEQELLNEILIEKKNKLTLAKSVKLKNESNMSKLDKDAILKILNDSKENSERKEIIINKCQSMFVKNFKGYNEDEMRNMIQEALKRYLNNNSNK